MSIKDKIKKDLKKSIIEKNELKKNLLRTIIGEFDRFDKDITEDKELSIIKKMRDNAILIKNEDESKILDEYLPLKLTEGEIKDYIDQVISDGNYSKKDMGKLMKTIKEEFGVSVDMKIASNHLKNILN